MVAMWELCSEGNVTGVRSALCLAVAQGGREEDINSKDRDNVTGLMWALLKKHNSIASMLLQRTSLDLNCTSINGKTALHFAAQVLVCISNLLFQIE